VAQTLARLHEQAAREDPPAVARVAAREAQLGAKVYGRERADLYAGAPLAIKREVGELIYAFALARRPTLAVEFGASLGLSTIYLAAALRDLAAGRLITTELDPDKARVAHRNLELAGLAELVELRVGDALETLRDLAHPVELLFLDGWNELYLDVLALLQPRLARGALVLADLSPDDPNLDRYAEYVTAPEHGYATVTVPLDAGLVVSSRITSS
jgi:predicted O-methyltransferase YrrM